MNGFGRADSNGPLITVAFRGEPKQKLTRPSPARLRGRGSPEDSSASRLLFAWNPSLTLLKADPTVYVRLPSFLKQK